MTTLPFIKWTGGKRWLIPELPEPPPSWTGRYVAPFVGGGAVFFALAGEGRITSAVLGDQNEALIGLYRNVATALPSLLTMIEAEAWQHDKDPAGNYERVRARFNGAIRPRGLFSAPDPYSIRASADFFYLNRTCFSGLFRLNARGEFNTARNKEVAGAQIFNDERVKRLEVASKLLRRINVTLLAGDYLTTMKYAGAGDLLFSDPPYDDTFDGYSASGFSRGEQRLLAGSQERAASAGVHVFTTNSDTPFIRSIYQGWHLSEHRRRERVAGGGGGTAGELLFTSWAR